MAGERARPFKVLYWNFLERHARRFAGEPRTALPRRHLQRLDRRTRLAIGRAADALRARYA